MPNLSKRKLSRRNKKDITSLENPQKRKKDQEILCNILTNTLIRVGLSSPLEAMILSAKFNKAIGEGLNPSREIQDEFKEEEYISKGTGSKKTGGFTKTKTNIYSSPRKLFKEIFKDDQLINELTNAYNFHRRKNPRYMVSLDKIASTYHLLEVLFDDVFGYCDGIKFRHEGFDKYQIFFNLCKISPQKLESHMKTLRNLEIDEVEVPVSYWSLKNEKFNQLIRKELASSNSYSFLV